MQKNDAWKELGMILYQRRNYLALTFQDVYDKIHFSVETIEKIEQGKLQEIPEIYLQDFLKRYTRLLGLPEDRIFQRYDQGLLEYQKQVKNTRNVQKIHHRTKPLSTGIKILAFLLSGVLLTQLWIASQAQKELQFWIQNQGIQSAEVFWKGERRMLPAGDSFSINENTSILIKNPFECTIMIKYGQKEWKIDWMEFEVQF